MLIAKLNYTMWNQNAWVTQATAMMSRCERNVHRYYSMILVSNWNISTLIDHIPENSKLVTLSLFFNAASDPPQSSTYTHTWSIIKDGDYNTRFQTRLTIEA